jgi:hypothetical protein
VLCLLGVDPLADALDVPVPVALDLVPVILRLVAGLLRLGAGSAARFSALVRA